MASFVIGHSVLIAIDFLIDLLDYSVTEERDCADGLASALMCSANHSRDDTTSDRASIDADLTIDNDEMPSLSASNAPQNIPSPRGTVTPATSSVLGSPMDTVRAHDAETLLSPPSTDVSGKSVTPCCIPENHTEDLNTSCDVCTFSTNSDVCTEQRNNHEINDLSNIDTGVTHDISTEPITSEYSQDCSKQTELSDTENLGADSDVYSQASSSDSDSGTHSSDSGNQTSQYSHTSESENEEDHMEAHTLLAPPKTDTGISNDGCVKSSHSPSWEISEEFIQRDSILVGYTYEFHERETEALEKKLEAHEKKTTKKIEYEQTARKRALGKIEKLEKEIKAKDQEIFDSRRTIMALSLEADALRDQVLAGTATIGTSGVLNNEADQAAWRLRTRIDTTLNEALGEAYGQRDEFAARFHSAEARATAAEAKLGHLKEEFKLRGYRKEQMKLFCEQHLKKVKAYQEDDLNMKIEINKKKLEVLRLSEDNKTLKNRIRSLEGVAKHAFGSLIPALDRFHEIDAKGLVNAASKSELEELRTLADWYDDLSAKAYNTVDEFEVQIAENERLQDIINKQRTENDELGDKVKNLNYEKDKLDNQVWDYQNEVMIKDSNLQHLEDALKTNKVEAAKVPILNLVINDLKGQLFHEWALATPNQWRVIITELQEQLNQARRKVEHQQKKLRKLEDIEEYVRTVDRNNELWRGEFKNLASKYALEYNRKRDAEDKLNHFRVAAGFEPISFLMDSGRPVMNEMYTRLKGPPTSWPQDTASVEHWRRMLTVDSGGRFGLNEIEGADEDSEEFGFMVPVGNGLYKKVSNAEDVKQDDMDGVEARPANMQEGRPTTPNGSHMVTLKELDSDDEEADDEGEADEEVGDKVEGHEWPDDVF